MVCNIKYNSKYVSYAFAIGIIVSFVIWYILLLVNWENNYSQFGMFFDDCDNFIADTTNVVVYTSELDPYNNTINGFGEKAYPPITYISTYLLSRIINVNEYIADPTSIYTNKKFMCIYIMLSIVQALFCYLLISKTIKGDSKLKTIMGIAVVVSAPFLFTIERGNTMILTALFSYIFILFYDSESKMMSELSLISLALAFNLKITPAILGILLVSNKELLKIIKVSLYSVAIFILSFIPIKGGLANIPLMFRNITVNLDNYTSRSGATLDASIYKLLTALNVDSPTIIGRILKLVRIGSIAAAVLLIFIIVFLSKDKVYNSLFAVLVLVLLPSHSGCYNVLYLIPAVILILNKIYIGLAELLFLAGMFIIMQDVMLFGFQSFSVDINIGIPIVFFAGICIAIDIIYSRYKEQRV